MRRSEERGSRGDWREMGIKPSVRRSGDGDSNKTTRQQFGLGAMSREMRGGQAYAVVPAKRRARRARAARRAQTGRERR
jgi:hypothetical protein